MINGAAKLMKDASPTPTNLQIKQLLTLRPQGNQGQYIASI
mgnify:FL=1